MYFYFMNFNFQTFGVDRGKYWTSVVLVDVATMVVRWGNQLVTPATLDTNVDLAKLVQREPFCTRAVETSPALC